MNESAIDIDQLDVDERLRLIERLWESLSKNPDSIPLTDAQKHELDRRLDEMDRGDVTGIPWNEVRERIQGRLK